MNKSGSPLDLLKSKLTKVIKSGKGWTAKCPAHDDGKNSLSLSEGKDGRALIHCFTGCPPENVVKAVGLEMTDLYPQGQESYLYPPKTSATAQPSGCCIFRRKADSDSDGNRTRIPDESGQPFRSKAYNFVRKFVAFGMS